MLVQGTPMEFLHVLYHSDLTTVTMLRKFNSYNELSIYLGGQVIKEM